MCFLLCLVTKDQTGAQQCDNSNQDIFLLRNYRASFPTQRKVHFERDGFQLQFIGDRKFELYYQNMWSYVRNFWIVIFEIQQIMKNENLFKISNRGDITSWKTCSDFCFVKLQCLFNSHCTRAVITNFDQ